jgi:hypothetical protein
MLPRENSGAQQDQVHCLRKQGNGGHQLHIDEHAEPVIYLVQLRGSFRTQRSHELRPVSLAQVQRFVVDVDHPLRHVLRPRVVHAVVVLRVILDQFHALISDHLLVARIVPIDGPEAAMVIGQIGSDHWQKFQ